MTLSVRNNYFRVGITLSFLSLAITLLLSFVSFSVYPQVGAAAVRTTGIFQSLVSRFFQPQAYVSLATMTSALLYALVAMILIYYFFEKTQSPEILFFALFVSSFAFEGLRTLVPLRGVYAIPAFYLLLGSRTLLFARFFGIYSLFAASVYAAGLGEQKQGNIVFIIAIAALVTALGVPIDSLAWDSSFMMIRGYPSMLRLVETGIMLITMISFLISAYSRGSREYIFIGIGSFLVFLGRTMLLSSDTWVTPLPALLLLAGGTWLICVQLHHVYLWI
ncbi:MAG: hypothetical protein LBK63_08050 [Treponema sp.]|jgi:hypothetical protein|nr:hypothetical protein [Treponema sp.]